MRAKESVILSARESDRVWQECHSFPPDDEIRPGEGGNGDVQSTILLPFARFGIQEANKIYTHIATTSPPTLAEFLVYYFYSSVSVDFVRKQHPASARRVVALHTDTQRGKGERR